MKCTKLQQIAFSHLSDMKFKNFMYFYKTFTAKPWSFFVIDFTLTSDNPLHFRT